MKIIRTATYTTTKKTEYEINQDRLDRINEYLKNITADTIYLPKIDEEMIEILYYGTEEEIKKAGYYQEYKLDPLYAVDYPDYDTVDLITLVMDVLDKSITFFGETVSVETDAAFDYAEDELVELVR